MSHMVYTSGAYMRVYVHICTTYKSLASIMLPEVVYTYFAIYISCYWHMSLNKYGYHIENIGNTALILHGYINLT